MDSGGRREVTDGKSNCFNFLEAVLAVKGVTGREILERPDENQRTAI
jgi:hypothetical protein